MLILCVGPDTFRAQERERELMAHFAQKYDVEQTSMERLEESGSALVDQLIERMHTPSLFTPRRFVRTHNLLADCPKGKYASLHQALTRDPEYTIIVDREDEPPSDQLLRAITTDVKVTRYDYPCLQGVAFTIFVEQWAKRLDCADHTLIQRIATEAQGDSWTAWNELLKCSAGGTLGVRSEEVSSLYELADAFLQAKPEWRTDLARAAQTPQEMQAFLGQVRALLRVRDGAAHTLPSFIVRKLQSWRIDPSTEERFARVILYYLLQRSGYANEDEGTLLLA